MTSFITKCSSGGLWFALLVLHHGVETSFALEPTQLYYNGNVSVVASGPTAPTAVTFECAVTITGISTYHYLNGGQAPGTIGLMHSDGTLFGPWPTVGRVGQGGVANAYWDAAPNLTLPAGAYTVVDSHPATWSHNTQSGGEGFVWIHGYEGAVAPGGTLWAESEGGNGHSYEVVAAPGGISWEAARDLAASRGGYLATLTSAAENTFVWDLLKDRNELWFVDQANNTIGPWLGGYQMPGSNEPAGGWNWLNGEGEFDYTAWAAGEPNNVNGVEHRVCFFGVGPNNRAATWNDASPSPWSEVLGYVIEFNNLAPRTIFKEDFESYTEGSDFIAQSAWAGSGPVASVVSTMTVNAGAYLESKVLDGRDEAGAGWIMAAAHPTEPLSSSGVTTLSVDTYSTTDPATINSGIGFGQNPNPVGFSFESFTVFWNVSVATGWEFDTRSIGGAREGFPGGTDRAVNLKIVVDGPAGEVYGVIDDAVEGRRETGRVAIPAETIAKLDTVSLFVDKSQSRTGPEFDNIEVTVAPSCVRGATFADWISRYNLPHHLGGSADDPNGDGVTNLAAFYSGFSPLENALPSQPSIVLAPDGRILMEFPRAKEVRGVTAILEVSTDGISWEVGPDPGVISGQHDSPTRETMAAELNALLKAHALARLRYEETP